MKWSIHPEMHRHPLSAPSGLAARAESANKTLRPGCLHNALHWPMGLQSWRLWRPPATATVSVCTSRRGTNLQLTNCGDVQHVEFEVLTAVVVKNTVFWDITPSSPLKVNRRFGGTSCLPSKIPAWKQSNFQRITRSYIPENHTVITLHCLLHHVNTLFYFTVRWGITWLKAKIIGRDAGRSSYDLVRSALSVRIFGLRIRENTRRTVRYLRVGIWMWNSNCHFIMALSSWISVCRKLSPLNIILKTRFLIRALLDTYVYWVEIVSVLLVLRQMVTN
jgi:hypothetical protein